MANITQEQATPSTIMVAGIGLAAALAVMCGIDRSEHPASMQPNRRHDRRHGKKAGKKRISRPFKEGARGSTPKSRYFGYFMRDYPDLIKSGDVKAIRSLWNENVEYWVEDGQFTRAQAKKWGTPPFLKKGKK
jgi:hypothetical protein